VSAQITDFACRTTKAHRAKDPGAQERARGRVEAHQFHAQQRDPVSLPRQGNLPSF